MAIPVKSANSLVVIGWMGTRTAYLNVDRQVAIMRYLRENPEDAGNIDREGFVQEFAFDDEFCTYDAWGM